MTKLCAHLNTAFPSIRLRVRFCHPPSPLRSQVDFDDVEDDAEDRDGCEIHYPSSSSPWPDEKQDQNTAGECHISSYGARRPSLHRKALPLVSILKRREALEDATPTATDGGVGNRQWIDDVQSVSDSGKHRCATCLQACTLVRDRAYPQGIAHAHSYPRASNLPKYERAFALLLQYLMKLQGLPTSLYPPTSDTLGELPAYSLRDPDASSEGKDYPWLESHGYEGVVASSRLHDGLESSLLLSTELKEGFLRLTSIGGLTLVLFALLA
ncbi:hypothetical protein H0H92_012760 [Tricholoma furcatifolium]|nr:hypothetical protein H0H92_012760 [Tricholoma furcatifolium]